MQPNPNAVPEYVALADMEIHTAPGARITLRPWLHGPNGRMPGLPCHLVLEPRQARQLAADIAAAADQSAEDAGQPRH